MDEEVWANEPYTQQDLVNQVNYMHTQPGGEQLFQDAIELRQRDQRLHHQAKSPLNYLTMMPAEYAAIGQPQGPAPFTLENLVSIATLVGGIFGNGGGDQLFNAVLYENMLEKFGPERVSLAGSPTVIARAKQKKANKKRKAKSKAGKKAKKPKPAVDHSGFATFLSFDDPNDPEAPTTVHRRSSPTRRCPRRARR